jgi:hypothetical protein
MSRSDSTPNSEPLRCLLFEMMRLIDDEFAPAARCRPPQYPTAAVHG